MAVDIVKWDGTIGGMAIFGKIGDWKINFVALKQFNTS